MVDMVASLLTANQLHEAGAMKSQVNLFVKAYGDSVDFSADNVNLEFDLLFDWKWARCLLGWGVARDQYDKAYAAAGKRWHRREAFAKIKHRRAQKPLSDSELNHVMYELWCECSKVRAHEWKLAYRRMFVIREEEARSLRIAVSDALAVSEQENHLALLSRAAKAAYIASCSFDPVSSCKPDFMTKSGYKSQMLYWKRIAIAVLSTRVE